MLTLRVREIGTCLPSGPADADTDDETVWRDSTIELQRGLDVMEVQVEVVGETPQAPRADKA